MKNFLILGFFVLSTLCLEAFAQSAQVAALSVEAVDISLLSGLAGSWKKIGKDMNLTLETETMSVKDRSNDINGTNTFFLVEPGYRVSKRVNVSTGVQYNVRQMNPAANQRESDIERNNSDHLENVFFKINYRPSKFSENGILDIRLQTRVMNDQNDIFKRRFGSDGNYQYRAYFGRPLIGKFSINRFTSYLRYKKYFLNSKASDFTRDHELRARISPTYTPIKGLDLSMTFTYNRNVTRSNSSVAGTNFSEELDIGSSIRYQKGPYAVLLWSDMQQLQTNKFGSLAENEKAGAQVTYGLNFAAFL